MVRPTLQPFTFLWPFVAVVSAVSLGLPPSTLPAAEPGEAGQASAQDAVPQNVRDVERRLLEEAASNIEAHRKTGATIRLQDTQGKPLAGAEVEIKQVGHAFLFGCIIFDLVWTEEPHQPELYKQRFQELFNFAVFPFYWRRYEPRPGQSMQQEAAEVVQWCRDNAITTKGHPLVWTNRSGVPEWVRGQPPEKSERLLLDRVRREVGGFAGQIDLWDVVNEPVNTRAWDHVESQDYVRDPIPRIADYVEKAFRAAREANPEAHLILNEYNTIARKEVRERFCQLVTELKRRQTPLSGLGIQAHEPREHWYPPEEVRATLDRLAGLGYPLHITEFIPQSGGKPITGGWRQGTWTERAQADFAEQIFRLAFGHPAVLSINWWGLSDRRIWLPGGGLITSDYQPKPVYERLRRLVHDEWNTRLSTATDDGGMVRFRGFYGRYAVTVKTAKGESQSFDAVLEKGQKSDWAFTVDL